MDVSAVSWYKLSLCNSVMCLSLYLPVSFSFCLPIYLCLPTALPSYWPTWFLVCLPLCLCVCLFSCLPLCLYLHFCLPVIFMFVSQFVCFSIFMSAYPHVCQPVYQSACLSPRIASNLSRRNTHLQSKTNNNKNWRCVLQSIHLHHHLLFCFICILCFYLRIIFIFVLSLHSRQTHTFLRNMRVSWKVTLIIWKVQIWLKNTLSLFGIVPITFSASLSLST